MKKNLSSRSVVLLAAVLLAACGSDGGATATESNDDVEVTTGSDESPTTEEATPATDQAAPTTAEEVPTTEEGAPTTEAVDGFEFTPPEGDYSAVFPAEPTANEQMAPLPDGSSAPVTIYFTESADGNSAFGTAAFVYPPGSVVTLEGARDGAIGNIAGTQTSSELITLQGRDGIQFTASVRNGDGTYLSRVYSDDVTLYQVIAIMEGAATFDDPEVAAFFDSFRFTEDL